MRELSIKEIIKAIPLEKEFKTKLLNGYDSYDEGMQTEIVQICYSAFIDLEQLLQDEKKQQFMIEVSQGTREMSENFRDEVDKAVWEEIESRINGTKEDTDELAKVRAHLESIISQTK